MNPLTARIQCNALPSPDATSNKKSADQHDPLKSALVQEAAVIGTVPKKSPVLLSTPASVGRSLCQHRPADAFLYKVKISPTGAPDLPASAVGPVAPLLSLGPRTDAVLDRFNLGDELLPRLRLLVETVRDTRWEARLRQEPWNLPFEQASNLAVALSADLRGECSTIVTVFFFLSRLAQDLAYIGFRSRNSDSSPFCCSCLALQPCCLGCFLAACYG